MKRTSVSVTAIKYGASSIAALSVAFGILASANAAEDKLALEEVLVTASKRGFAETLQSVPLSIQALTERTLEQAGAKDFFDFARMAPSVSVVDQGIGSAQVSIRGVRVGVIPAQTTQEKPLTSIYYDDLPVSFANFNPNLDLFDVQRVEVLRGPQGTLYGAGAMGGNIRFVTNRANLTDWEVKGEGTIATIRHGGEIYDLKGLVNAPVVEDRLALRITGTMNWDDGYIDNVFLGEKDWNRSRRKGVRASALFQPSEDLSIIANFIYQDMEFDHGRGQINIPGLRNPTQSYYSALPFLDEIAIYNLTVEYDLGWANFFSSSSYYDRNMNESGTVQELMEAYFGVQSPYPNRVLWDNRDFVQEFRLTSPQEQRLTWVVGAFYANQKTDYMQDFTYPGFGEMFEMPTDIYGAPEDVLFYGDVSNRQKQYALFGEATYNITDDLHFTAGLRWFDWKQKFDLLYAGFFQGGLYPLVDKTSANKFTPKFTLSYKGSDDWMVYATAAKGYRLGGMNDPVPSDLCADDLNEVGLTEAPTTFAPDSLWSYELGAKTQWFERRMTLNAALFYIDWTAVQTLKRLPNCGFYFTENVGKVESKGIEVEMVAMPVRGLTVMLSGTYTDATLAEDVPNLFGVEGDRVPYVPKFALSASVEYMQPIANSMDGYIRFDLQHVGHRNTEFNEALGIDMDSYQIGNVHVGVQMEKWEVALFVKNIWDKRAILSAENNFGIDNWTIERPRTIGLTVRAHY
ncbi:MAG: TonB-dependent receptor [Sphingomonadales bacterium]|nr:TonB-dependent receptor [Sphingomonadales bacterium]